MEQSKSKLIAQFIAIPLPRYIYIIIHLHLLYIFYFDKNILLLSRINLRIFGFPTSNFRRAISAQGILCQSTYFDHISTNLAFLATFPSKIYCFLMQQLVGEIKEKTQKSECVKACECDQLWEVTFAQMEKPAAFTMYSIVRWCGSKILERFSRRTGRWWRWKERLSLSNWASSSPLILATTGGCSLENTNTILTRKLTKVIKKSHSCRAENSLGRARAHTSITGKPAAPVFTRCNINSSIIFIL